MKNRNAIDKSAPVDCEARTAPTRVRRISAPLVVAMAVTLLACLAACSPTLLLDTLITERADQKSGTVATPAIDPTTGSYSSDQNVVISCSTSGATIHYTTDGSTPNEESATYNGPIAVAGGGTVKTIRAIGAKAGMYSSSVADATITIDYTQVSTPQFAPGEGTYSSAQNVTISSSTADAAIRYTSDGSIPSETNGTLYATPVAISVSTTLKAIAYKSGMKNSTIATASYVRTYAVTYKPNGASSGNVPLDNTAYIQNQSVTVRGNTGTLAKSLYGFAGWNTSSDGSGVAYTEGQTFTMGTSDITLWAQWHVSRLASADAAASDLFGSGVATSADGTVLVVGAYAKTISYGGQGAAYVYTKSGSDWVQAQRLVASDGAAGDLFGWSVACSGDGNVVVAGAYSKTVSGNTMRGAAYVFVRSGNSWTQMQKLTASDGAASDCFGLSVATTSDGGTVVVGACQNLSYRGAAYVFTRSGSTWNQAQKLTASDGSANDYFGTSVASSSDGATLAVGAPGKTVSGNAARGAVYVFIKSGSSWAQLTELTASDGAASDQFGSSAALASNGSTLVVGARVSTVSGVSSQGAAYVFTCSGTTWSQAQKLTASDGAANDYFGASVASSSDGATLVVGAYGKNNEQGATYVFTKSGGSWSQAQKLTGYDGTSGDWHGWSVATPDDGSVVFVGARAKTVGSNSTQGAVYPYVRSASHWY